jgi:hypothetical protein
MESWDWLTDSLCEKFEGYTIAPSFYEGVWKSPRTGKPIGDQSRKYYVALAASKVDSLRHLLAEACVVFRQQAIYLSVAGSVEFIEGPNDGPSG